MLVDMRPPERDLAASGEPRQARRVAQPASWPAITTRLVHNLKNTALVSFVAVPDLFSAMQGAISESFRATELLTLTAIVYLGLTLGFSAILGRVDVALHRGRRDA